MPRLAACLVVLTAALFLACGAGPTKPGRRITVTREQYGERWPFTVDAGELECIPGRHPEFRSEHLILFHHGGQTYAVSGNAISKGYARPDPIWRDDPNSKFKTKMDLDPLREAGLKLCK